MKIIRQIGSLAFGFTRGAYEEAARCKREKGLQMELLTVEDLLEKIRQSRRGST